MKDYYEVLGVDPDSSPQEIKSAFRKQAKNLHPDMHYAAMDTPLISEEAVKLRESAMRLLLEAYKVLSDARKAKSIR